MAYVKINIKTIGTYPSDLDWIFKVFDEDGGGTIDLDEVIKIVIGLYNMNGEQVSASKSSIRRFVITEKAPTRAFSWLKAATTAFTFKTLKTLC